MFAEAQQHKMFDNFSKYEIFVVPNRKLRYMQPVGNIDILNDQIRGDRRTDNQLEKKE
jgi:hypothetical protein